MICLCCCYREKFLLPVKLRGKKKFNVKATPAFFFNSQLKQLVKKKAFFTVRQISFHCRRLFPCVNGVSKVIPCMNGSLLKCKPEK